MKGLIIDDVHPEIAEELGKHMEVTTNLLPSQQYLSANIIV